MATPIVQKYIDQIEVNNLIKTKIEKKEHILPGLRFTVFILILVSFYNYLTSVEAVFLILAGSAFLAFLLLTWWDNHLKNEIERHDRLIQICRNEIKALSGDYSPFDPGLEFIDPDHSYTYDLDLFGKQSLFHSINRCVTIFGKNRLAISIMNAFHFSDQISERQSAILELSEKQEFRQQMQLVFFDVVSNEKERSEVTQWLNQDNLLMKERLINLIRYILPAITISSIVISSLGLLIVQVPILLFILQLFIVSLYGRKTILTQTLLTKKANTISKYAHLLALIEKNNFDSQYLKVLKHQLSHAGVEAPSKIINQLFRLLNWMDANLNLLAALMLNGLFLFNLHILVAVEKWKSRYREDIPGWFETIGEIDALASLANFASNNPEFIIPVAVEDQFLFEASDLGHPLIPRSECVTNDIIISGWNQYCIITGANMSGKSTFLRTVGINYILAMMGGPVFATRFVFCPVKLHSSIRTNDSLARKESFFYAELKRLKSIITELENGQRTFILLDEILKGTNSKDKQAGSIALLEQLIKYQSVGLIATHDLILGDLISNYPKNIHNLCFEIHIVNDEMSIDYKLEEGVCKNLNATFLMKKMGILIDK